MMMTLKISKLTKMTTERRVRTCRSQPMFFPADLAYQVIFFSDDFLLCVFTGHSLLILFTGSPINVTVSPWHYGISMFHNFILFIENVLFFPELLITLISPPLCFAKLKQNIWCNDKVFKSALFPTFVTFLIKTIQLKENLQTRFAKKSQFIIIGRTNLKVVSSFKLTTANSEVVFCV